MKTSAFALAMLALAPSGCAAPAKDAAATSTAPSLHLTPLTDLAPAAGLGWLVEVHPRALASNAALVPALAELFPEAALDRATTKYALDPRQTDEAVYAQYQARSVDGAHARTTLILARVLLDPGKVAAAFTAKLLEVEGRAQDPSAIVRTWGTLAESNEPAQMATFGVQAAGLEIGHFGPLRAAELFAEQKLKKASPALAAEPLKGSLDKLTFAGATATSATPELRAFLPGPFSADLAPAFGGLLGASTAAALAMHVKEATASSARPALAFRLVLTGAWGSDSMAAAERLGAAFHVMTTSLSGKLLGLDSYAASPEVHGLPDALVLEVTYDAETLAHALHLATAGSLEQLLSPGISHPD